MAERADLADLASGDAGTGQCHYRRDVEAVGHLHLPLHTVLDQQLIEDIYLGRHTHDLQITRVHVWHY